MLYCVLDSGGEVREWLNRLAWKAGVQQCTEGSNPSLSATPACLWLFCSWSPEGSIHCGEVTEWLNGAVSETVEHFDVPRVRIPASPPENSIAAMFGGVAQLGERFVRNEEVSGSIPLISTKH